MSHIGVPKETKADEHRVALSPAGARELSHAGHQVLIETGAGDGAGMTDDDFRAQNAMIVESAEQLYAECDLILKVKEPQAAEIQHLEPRHTVFAYLHLAADAILTRRLLSTGASYYAYETVTDSSGRLPLLAPMSEIAGRLSTQAAASLLEKPRGGAGVLLGAVAGVMPARVVVLGAGVVGVNAAAVAAGMGADVYLFDRNIDRLRELQHVLDERVRLCYSSLLTLEEQLNVADVVIGAVLVAGARAPRLVSRSQLSIMKRTAVMIDVAIDQGGCFETSHPTTHSDPTYVVDGIVHYCVANMPGAVPVTATLALTNATLPYVLALANGSTASPSSLNPNLLSGLNISRGRITCEAVAIAHDLEFTRMQPPDGDRENVGVPA